MLKLDKSFERYHMPKHHYYDRLHKRFDFMIKNIKGPNIIDIGCGGGLTPFLLAQRDDIELVVGIDIQQEVLDKAKKNVISDKVSFQRCEAEHLPYDDNIFDTAVITETLEHVEDVDKTLKEACRVMKNNGRIVITVPNKGRVKKRQGPWSHIRSFDEENLLECANKYFKCIKVGIENCLYYIGEKRK